MSIGDARRPLPSHIYRLIWQRTRFLQIVVIVFGLGLPTLAVIPLEIQRRVVDQAIPNGDLELLGLLAIAYAAASAGAALLKFVIYYLRGKIEARVTRFLRVRALDAQRKRSPHHARRAIGPVSSVVVEEAYPLGGFAAQAINTPLIEGGAMLGVAGFMLVSEPWLAAIGLGTIAVQGIVVPIVQHRINQMSRRRVNAVRRANADMIAAADTADTAGYSQALFEVRLGYRLRLRMNVFKAGLKAFLKLSDNLAVIVVLGVGGLMVVRGETSLGIIVAFLEGLRRVRQPWDALVSFYRTFADAQIKYRLVLGAMGQQVVLEPDDDPGPAIRVSLP
jgi:ABC-type bacteriocin/lantibiotic exporter with double-glycine peptidase domain